MENCFLSLLGFFSLLSLFICFIFSCIIVIVVYYKKEAGYGFGNLTTLKMFLLPAPFQSMLIGMNKNEMKVLNAYGYPQDSIFRKLCYRIQEQ